MIKFLRKYNKKLLAFCGVFLMISFMAVSRSGPSGGRQTGLAVGHILGNVPLLDTDLDRARQNWKMLKQSVMVQVPDSSGAGQQMRWVPIIALRQFQFLQGLEDSSTLVALLVKEANQMGVVVSDQQIADFFTHGIGIQLPDSRVVPYDQITDEDYKAEVHDAAGTLLTVLDSVDRAERITKVSKPLRDLAVAEAHQSVQVRFASLEAGKFAQKVPAPTTQQLEAQFDQFADAEPTGMSSDKNPFGFGYKIPSAVRLQTISIPRSELKTAVRKTKSDYDWDVAARVYYRSHQDQFKVDAKNTPPSDASPVLATTHPAATTKPFDEVKSRVLDLVMAPDITALGETVQKVIQDKLEADWRAYHRNNASSQATTSTATASTLGPDYASYDYLKALAAKIQQDFSVLPATADYNQPLTSSDLSKLPGIGSAHSAGSTAGGLDFGAAASSPQTGLFEPSQPFSGDDETTYLFRLTDRIPAHRPASVNDVLAAVTADWKRAQAYDLAKKSADALLAAARTTGLPAAAAATGLTVQTTGWFGGSVEPSGEAPPTAVRGETSKLLATAARHEPAITLAEAPTQAKVFVIELASIRPDWQEGHLYSAQAQAVTETRSELAQPLQYEWFNLPAVEARLGYKAVQKDNAG